MGGYAECGGLTVGNSAGPFAQMAVVLHEMAHLVGLNGSNEQYDFPRVLQLDAATAMGNAQSYAYAGMGRSPPLLLSTSASLLTQLLHGGS